MKYQDDCRKAQFHQPSQKKNIIIVQCVCLKKSIPHGTGWGPPSDAINHRIQPLTFGKKKGYPCPGPHPAKS